MRLATRGLVRVVSVLIMVLTFASNAQAQDIFSDYARADFDAVREDLSVANFENLDSSGQDSYLNIAHHIYAVRPAFPLSELSDLYGELAGVMTSAYTRKRLNGLIAALADAELLADHNSGKALARVNALATELGQVKGFVVPHDIYGRLAVIGLYAARNYKAEGDEQDLLVKAYTDSLRGRSNDEFEDYLENCEACVYAQQVKGIVARGQMGRVGGEPYLVNAEPYDYSVESSNLRPDPPMKRFPVEFIDRATPDDGLARFIASLTAAAEAKDGAPILASVADDFTFERDFGGMVSADMSAAVKFQQAIPIDVEDLAEEYKDYGWDSLLELLRATQFQGSDREMCGPVEPLAAEDMPDDYYFFGGYINGAGVRVRAAPSLEAGIIQTLSYEAMLLVAILEGENQMLWAKIRLRNGEVGYVAGQYFGGFLLPQLCYRKDGDDWRISAYIGGGD